MTIVAGVGLSIASAGSGASSEYGRLDRDEDEATLAGIFHTLVSRCSSRWDTETLTRRNSRSCRRGARRGFVCVLRRQRRPATRSQLFLPATQFCQSETEP